MKDTLKKKTQQRRRNKDDEDGGITGEIEDDDAKKEKSLGSRFLLHTAVYLYAHVNVHVPKIVEWVFIYVCIYDF